MFVLGIDPGLSRCGYGVVEQGRIQPEAVALGVIKTHAHAPNEERLDTIHQNLEEMINE